MSELLCQLLRRFARLSGGSDGDRDLAANLPLQELPHEGRDQQSAAQLSAQAGQVAAVFTTDEDDGPSRSKGSPQPPHGGVSGDVQDEVVSNTAVRPVLIDVVDDVIGAERGDEIELPGAAHSGDAGAQRLS